MNIVKRSYPFFSILFSHKNYNNEFVDIFYVEIFKLWKICSYI